MSLRFDNQVISRNAQLVLICLSAALFKPTRVVLVWRSKIMVFFVCQRASEHQIFLWEKQQQVCFSRSITNAASPTSFGLIPTAPYLFKQSPVN